MYILRWPTLVLCLVANFGGATSEGGAGGSSLDQTLLDKIFGHVSEDCKSEVKNALSSRAEIRESCKLQIGEILASVPRRIKKTGSPVQNADHEDGEGGEGDEDDDKLTVPVEDIQASGMDGPTVVVFSFIVCVLLAAVVFCVRSYTELSRNGLFERPAKKLSKQKRKKDLDKRQKQGNRNF